MDYDLGVVSLTGELVKLQMNKKGVIQRDDDIRSNPILRKATEKDVKKLGRLPEVRRPKPCFIAQKNG